MPSTINKVLICIKTDISLYNRLLKLILEIEYTKSNINIVKALYSNYRAIARLITVE